MVLVSRSAMRAVHRLLGQGVRYRWPIIDSFFCKLSLQLFDLGKFTFETGIFRCDADCEKNLVILNFIQVSTIIDFSSRWLFNALFP
jgi:hypothetical protein